MRMLQEECAELIVAASHLERGRKDAFDNFIEEIADVEIMIEQVCYGLVVDVEPYKERKLIRLREKIDEYKQKNRHV